MSITLTEQAAQHIRKTLSARENAIGLRVGVRTRGCTGFAYVIEMAEAIQADDHVFEHLGVKIVINEASLPILNGTELDYVSKGLNRSFEFNNPNAEHHCGCGESFSIKSEKTTENS